MSYRVTLDEAVISKIQGWGFSPSVIRAILERLDELSQGSPSRHLIRVGGAEHVLQADLVAREAGPPVRDYLIVLSVRYSTDEETLMVVDCERLAEDRMG